MISRFQEHFSHQY